MINQKLFLCFLLLSGISVSSYVNAQDSLYTKYGDLLIGEIEKITFEKVYFKTSYRSAAIDIKFSEIENIKSYEGFLLNDTRNRDWRGTLVLDSLSKDLIGIQTPDTIYFFEAKEIFELTIDQKKKFKDKYKLGIDAGYTRARADNSLSLSLGLTTNYKTRRWDTGLDYKDFASVIGERAIGRTSLHYNLSYILPREWFFNGKLLKFSSTEQDLDIRNNYVLGLGKAFINRESRNFYVVTGLVSNREMYSSNSKEFKSTEGMAHAHLEGSFFENFDLSTDWTIFKTFDGGGRFRNSINFVVKYLFLNHFNIGIHYVLNTDNKPPVETSNADYVFELNFGWKLQKR